MNLYKPLAVLVLIVPFLIAGRCEQQFESFQGEVDRVSQQAGPIVEAAKPWLTPTQRSLIEAIGVILGAVAVRKIKADAVSIPRAMEIIKAKTGGTIDFNDPDTKAVLNTVMTPGGKAIVDQAQSKKRQK